MKNRKNLLTTLVIFMILMIAFLSIINLLPQASYAGTCGTCNGTCYENVCGGTGSFYPVAGNIGWSCNYCQKGGLGWEGYTATCDVCNDYICLDCAEQGKGGWSRSGGSGIHGGTPCSV